MREVTLAAVSREAGTKGMARRCRMNGNIPAVVYGPEIKPFPVAVDRKVFRLAIKTAGGTNSIFDLDVDGNHSSIVIRDIQVDPVTSMIVHLDFHAISMTKPIQVSIPVKFIGTPRGVKTDGGIMQTIIRDLDISCLPADLPESVEISVEELGIGESLHVSDLVIENVTIRTEARRTVVTIAAPTVIKSVEAEEDEAELEEGAEAPAEGEEGATPAEGDKPAEGGKPEGGKPEGGKPEKK